MLGTEAADLPAVVLRNFEKASFEGARIVILDAPVRAVTRAG